MSAGLTRREAAERIGVSTQTVRQYEKSGRIRSWIDATGTRRLDEMDVDRVAAEQAGTTRKKPKRETDEERNIRIDRTERERQAREEEAMRARLAANRAPVLARQAQIDARNRAMDEFKAVTLDEYATGRKLGRDASEVRALADRGALRMAEPPPLIVTEFDAKYRFAPAEIDRFAREQTIGGAHVASVITPRPSAELIAKIGHDVVDLILSDKPKKGGGSGAAA